jgi:hypothetical protein
MTDVAIPGTEASAFGDGLDPGRPGAEPGREAAAVRRSNIISLRTQNRGYLLTHR